MNLDTPQEELEALIAFWREEILAHYQGRKPGLPANDRWSDFASENLAAMYESLEEPDSAAFETAMRALVDEEKIPSENYLAVHFPFLTGTTDAEL